MSKDAQSFFILIFFVRYLCSFSEGEADIEFFISRKGTGGKIISFPTFFVIGVGGSLNEES